MLPNAVPHLQIIRGALQCPLSLKHCRNDSRSAFVLVAASIDACQHMERSTHKSVALLSTAALSAKCTDAEDSAVLSFHSLQHSLALK